MLIACGEALIDMVPERDSLGRDIYVPCFGGSPYNTAIAAGRILGAENGKNRTAFLSRLSRDFFGTALTENLERNCVSTALLARSAETTTLAFVKLEAGREPEYIFYTEGASDRSFGPGDLPVELPPETSCIFFGSISLTMEPSASTIENFIFREKERPGGPVISHDPNVRPMMIRDREAYVRRFENWVRASTIVKISSADFDFIYPGAGLEQSMGKILALGPSLLVVTLGKDGALALLPQRENASILRVSAPAPELPAQSEADNRSEANNQSGTGEGPADTIGAGDTFHGAFLAKLEMSGAMSRETVSRLGAGELREALVFANRAAAIVCSRKGANPPTLKEMTLSAAEGRGQ